MSASNRAACPRCIQVLKAKLEAHRAEVEASYGVVPVDQFEQAREQLAKDQIEAMRPPQTLREDYEIHGAVDGVVIVEYSCGCQVCGLSTEFTYRHGLGV